MNKKGLRILSEQMFVLFEIILIGLIAVGFMRYIYGFGEGSSFERAWVSHDLKMLLESVVSSPQLAVYDYAMPESENINQSATKINVKNTSIQIETKQTDKKPDLKTTQLFIFSEYRTFSGRNASNFSIITNGNNTYLSDITEQDIKQLVCERYKQADTRKTGKKAMVFNKNPENSRIVELLTDYFTKGQRSSFYEIKDSGDIYVHIHCSQTSQIIINKPIIENQKLACLLAEKIEEIKYDDII
ncbi:hypothetical protein KY312_00210, partial [Candidatus Woesearchaeota archaeon]|nr:hypothetical protein [Candidatus Woesearchaeota archaeon]